MKKVSCWLLSFLLLFAFTMPQAYAEEMFVSHLDAAEPQLQILIVADVQDTAVPQKATINFLHTALDETQPDLVILLGDMIHGPSVHGRAETEQAIHEFLQPIVTRNIPFAIVFGNHDDQSGVPKEEQLQIYQQYAGCLSIDGEDLPGCGNYYLIIENELNKNNPFVLWFVDSGTYAPASHGTYGYVTEQQNEWMLRAYLNIQQQYSEPVSFVFQHIPVPQVYQLLQEVSFGTKNAITPLGPGFLKWYQPKEDLVWAGRFGEGPCASEYDSGEFATWKEMNVQAAFFGHDHMNDYCGTVDGIDLIATPGIGFYMYGRRDAHGVRLVTLNANEPFDYETEMICYQDIMDASLPIYATLGSMLFNHVLAAIAGIAVLLAVIFCVFKYRKKIKRAHQNVNDSYTPADVEKP